MELRRLNGGDAEVRIPHSAPRRRTREIGIRRALGATLGRVGWQVVMDGLKPVAAGIVLGLAASFWSTMLWSWQLFEVSPTDPLT